MSETLTSLLADKKGLTRKLAEIEDQNEKLTIQNEEMKAKVTNLEMTNIPIHIKGMNQISNLINIYIWLLICL